MRSVRSFVVAALAVVVLAVPAVVLADGRVALVVGNSTYAHRAAAEPGQRRPGPVGVAAAARVRGDDRVQCLSGGADRGATRVHASERRGGRVAGVLRGPRHRDGRRQLRI